MSLVARLLELLSKVRLKFLAPALLLCFSTLSHAATSILTNLVNNQRTGANLNETILTTTNVSTANFGKLATFMVEGFVNAQPLLVSGVTVQGKSRNVLYVATMNNVVYAFDADDYTSTGGLLWQVRLNALGGAPIPAGDVAGSNENQWSVRGNVGIMGTPVIDPAAGAIYLVTRTIENGSFIERLHALDITTGGERAHSPVQISYTDPTGAWSFDPLLQAQRPGLTLSAGQLIIGWGSVQDIGANQYHGWVMSYDASTLALTGVFCTTCEMPSSSGASFGGGVWQSGRGLVTDSSGNIFLFTGNGFPSGQGSNQNFAASCSSDSSPPNGYFGDSLVKLAPGGFSTSNIRAAAVASVLPSNWCSGLDKPDLDLGGSGPALITENNKTLLVGGGKDGILRVFDASQLNTLSGLGTAQVTSVTFPVNPPSGSCDHHIMGGPVYWNRSSGSAGSFPNSSLIYVSAESDVVSAFNLTLSGTSPQLTLSSESSDRVIGHPGGILALSANSNVAGSGILWVAYGQNSDCTFNDSAVWNVRPGTLRAYNASNLAIELWNSDMAGTRDTLGYFAKFMPPTVANGKVYMAAWPVPESYYSPGYTYYAGTTYSSIVVYGLNPPQNPPVVRNFGTLTEPPISLIMQ